MRLQFDLDAGALYIELCDRPVARTRHVDESTLVDLDADGIVLGIELTAIERGLPLDAVLSGYRVLPADAAELRAYFALSGLPARILPEVSTGRAPAARVLEDCVA